MLICLKDRALKPSDLTREALRIPITVTMALGSTNATLHLLAMLLTANVELTLDIDFNVIQEKVPHLAD